jgi:hypothetical protein
LQLLAAPLRFFTVHLTSRFPTALGSSHIHKHDEKGLDAYRNNELLYDGFHHGHGFVHPQGPIWQDE